MECQLNLAVIQTGGVGYEVNVPLTTSEKLPVLGEVVRLHIQAVYREDSKPFMDLSIVNLVTFFV